MSLQQICCKPIGIARGIDSGPRRLNDKLDTDGRSRSSRVQCNDYEHCFRDNYLEFYKMLQLLTSNKYLPTIHCKYLPTIHCTDSANIFPQFTAQTCQYLPTIHCTVTANIYPQFTAQTVPISSHNSLHKILAVSV